ncbi:MAG: hypothetical protein H0T42_12770, partial [Deltaproteobacteria bacterium]|nr:hypothetical protein [Deltaproteobacteria bacterium]
MVVLRSSGAVTDRPWGVTLAGLGVQQFTGLLTLNADGKEFSISFDLGRIVGATSPLASDAAVRLALTNHLVTSTQAPELNRQILENKDRDELELLAEIAGLLPEHIAKLRHRLVVQRAARTFSIEKGTYAADERIAMPPGADIDVREVIYLGARMNLSQQRLADALRTFGAGFKIKPDALPAIEQFVFTDAERPVLQSLVTGTSLPELEAAHRDVDQRMAHAIVYALVACRLCDTWSTPGADLVVYDDGPDLTASSSTPEASSTYIATRTTPSPAVGRAPTGRLVEGDATDAVELPSPDVPSAPRDPRPPPRPRT